MMSSHTNSDDEDEKNHFLDKLTHMTQKVQLF
jgi:hypothetical protein